MSVLISSEEEISSPGVLSQETIEKMGAEVERLTKLKARRLKEIFMKKRLELEEICKTAHIEPDAITAPEQTNEMIDSGMLDPSELLAN
ncbi:65-kDa microtubule-associated protein 6-like [Oryza brachyantha]|uniref:65-kDa microtubule-associated protein 6-like n=1 Tax=Oryza brachyantha TaxID=4533 RepID=UPI001AD9C866|nr:65-kDa microtubule-associated protein 6-like [Oryza brachyantha]